MYHPNIMSLRREEETRALDSLCYVTSPKDKLCPLLQSQFSLWGFVFGLNNQFIWQYNLCSQSHLKPIGFFYRQISSPVGNFTHEYSKRELKMDFCHYLLYGKQTFSLGLMNWQKSSFTQISFLCMPAKDHNSQTRNGIKEDRSVGVFNYRPSYNKGCWMDYICHLPMCQKGLHLYARYVERWPSLSCFDSCITRHLISLHTAQRCTRGWSDFSGDLILS